MLGKILDQFGSRKNKKVWGLGGLSSKGPQIKIRSQKRIEKKNRAGGKSGRIGMSCEGESMRFCTSKKPSGATEAPANA